ncbi:PBP1A family penicillin-binding protein [Patescibacteria group bacterium]|nr:PBP1A family penicillin-binding protein [Patescibacteria group bacterium]
MTKKRRSKIFKIIMIVFALALISGAIAASAAAFWMATLKIPDFDSFESRKVIQSTKIYDRTGQILLWDIHENIKRTKVPSEQISRNLKNATVAIEDSNFYNHKGVDFSGILRAVLTNLSSGSLHGQGGSTITQQVIKNTMLTTEKSFARKFKELILALKLEQSMSKEKILEIYLNEIPYGGSNYGAETASQNYFGKSAADLNLAEAAYLAALPQAPTYYSPYGNNREALDQRKNLVLKRMKELGFITEEEEKSAMEQKVNFMPQREQSVRAAHFSIFIRSYLENKYGKDVIEQNGLKVITTLDYETQQKAEELVAKYAKENKEKFNANNAGLVAIDPKTGQIIAMVGSKDYFNQEDGGNFNVTLAKRQPGSSIKPFIYATAFKEGYTPDTVVFDLKTEFSASCNADGTAPAGINPESCYMPENYDHIFRGPVTLRNAIAQSINVPSVKTLYLAGIKDSLATIKDMGITTLNDPDRYGLTLVLGGGEVTLLEMTSAYGIFANQGMRNPTVGILKIEDSNGNVLEEFKESGSQVIDKNIALLISDVLSDNDARAPAFGERSYLYFPDRDVAVKTGTTNDYRDAWVIGYTPNLAWGVWCGNNDNSSMEKRVAGFIAAPLWNAFFTEIAEKLEKQNFEKPEKQPEPKPFLWGDWRGGLTYKIDKISKKLATEFTPPELIEEKPIVQIHSILYWINKDDPLGPAPEKPEDDSQFRLWEIPVRNWAANQNIKEQTEKDIPKEYDDVHKPEYSPQINIISPDQNTVYNPENPLNISISHSGKFPMGQVDFFFNNNYLGSSNAEPFNFFFYPSKIEGWSETSTLRIVAYDNVRNKTEVSMPIKFQISNP